MSIETLLERYPADVATLRLLESTLLDHEDIIIHSSKGGSGERVQTSGTSDITADKAIQLVELREIMVKREHDLTARIKAVESGLDLLTDVELQAITLRYFEYRGVYEVSDIMGLSIRSIHRYLSSAKLKIKDCVKEFMVHDRA